MQQLRRCQEPLQGAQKKSQERDNSVQYQKILRNPVYSTWEVDRNQDGVGRCRPAAEANH